MNQIRLSAASLAVFSIVLLGGLSGCATDRVDPAYEALVAQQATGSTPVAGSLGPGDKFSLRVHDEEGLSGDFTVSGDGTINYPYVGRIDVNGMTCGQIERAITEGLADGYLLNPSVSCAIVEYNSKKVFVFGEVKKPGSYPYQPTLPLAAASARAGGATARPNPTPTNPPRSFRGGDAQGGVPMQEVVKGPRSNV